MSYEPMTGYATGDVIPEVAWDRYQNNIQWLYDYVIPVGVWVPYAGTVLPEGRWLWCNGQAVSRTTYSDLFSVCGTAYGSGDGSTTFNVPDMRGRAWIGMDDMPGGAGAAGRVTAAWADSRGGSGGAETHTLSASELAAHSHPITFTDTTVGGSKLVRGHINVAAYGVKAATDNNTGGGSAHNNMQPSLAAPAIIKY